MFSSAIVRPPAPNFAEGLTNAGLGAPDYLRALEQHAAYCTALEDCGVHLIRLDADKQYPDSCFVEDAAIVTDALPLGRTTDPDVAMLIANDAVPGPRNNQAILTRPGTPSRAGEAASMRHELAHLFHSISEIRAPGTLDGGDVCEAGTHFFIGISERTNEAGARQLAEIVTTRAFTSSFVDIRSVNGLLHLKSAIAYVGDNRLVTTEALRNRAEFRGYDLIHVDPGEEYAANCIAMDGRVLIAAGYPRFENKLRDLGYRTIALEMSEFQKMDGGLSCLSVRW